MRGTSTLSPLIPLQCRLVLAGRASHRPASTDDEWGRNVVPQECYLVEVVAGTVILALLFGRYSLRLSAVRSDVEHRATLDSCIS